MTLKPTWNQCGLLFCSRLLFRCTPTQPFVIQIVQTIKARLINIQWEIKKQRCNSGRPFCAFALIASFRSLDNFFFQFCNSLILRLFAVNLNVWKRVISLLLLNTAVVFCKTRYSIILFAYSSSKAVPDLKPPIGRLRSWIISRWLVNSSLRHGVASGVVWCELYAVLFYATAYMGLNLPCTRHRLSRLYRRWFANSCLVHFSCGVVCCSDRSTYGEFRCVQYSWTATNKHLTNRARLAVVGTPFLPETTSKMFRTASGRTSDGESFHCTVLNILWRHFRN